MLGNIGLSFGEHRLMFSAQGNAAGRLFDLPKDTVHPAVAQRLFAGEPDSGGFIHAGADRRSTTFASLEPFKESHAG